MPSVAATLRMLLSLLAALTSGGPNMVGTVEATVRTFGSPTVTSWPSTRIVLGEAPSVIFNHTVSGDAQWACMDHFWITANSDLAMAAMGARLEVRYHFDGEPTPSVSFEPAMMSGNGWAAVPLAGRWVDGMSGVGQEGVYAAGDKVGRGGRLTGWFNNLRLPFKHSVFVTAQLATRPGSAPPPNASTSSQDTEHNPPPVNPPNPPYPSGPVPSPHCKDLPAPASAHCINADIIVRGFEDTSSSNAALTLPSGLTLPRTARMRLHHFEDIVDGYEYATLANVSAGHEGLLFGVSVAIETSPPWGEMQGNKIKGRNSWIEGCWNIQRRVTEPLPGLVLGTGFEDFFDSTYGFNILGPDLTDPTAALMSPRLQRKCSANGTAPWVINPSKAQHGVCHEGVLFQHSNAGVMHYSTDLTPKAVVDPKLKLQPPGVERVAVYRFLDAEIVSFEDGGALVWRNNDPGPSPKCRCETPQKTPPQTPPVHVRSYVWLYEWPKE